jgi:pimeloyl-ACP methyl ester carboxylesterase
MIPFYFGTSSLPLFGAHSPPSKGARDSAVVLVPPMGQEAIRAHRAIRQLGLRLARERFHALRFDLRGTGDSAGDFADARVDAWVEDTCTAMDELRDRTGVQRVSLVGLRLGAAVAWRATRGRRDVDKVVLWEPVVSGARYLSDLGKRHEDFLRAELPRRRTAPFERAGEALGYPLSKELSADLAEIDLANESKPDARALVVVTTPDAEDRALETRLPTLTPRSDFMRLTVVQDWNSDEAVNTSLVPSEALDAIVKALVER